MIAPNSAKTNNVCRLRYFDWIWRKIRFWDIPLSLCTRNFYRWLYSFRNDWEIVFHKRNHSRRHMRQVQKLSKDNIHETASSSLQIHVPLNTKRYRALYILVRSTSGMNCDDVRWPVLRSYNVKVNKFSTISDDWNYHRTPRMKESPIASITTLFDSYNERTMSYMVTLPNRWVPDCETLEECQ